ncbi:TPA: DUF550 domain-containing protein [Klebsiella pneumoniae subsp. pneumoniae]|nr:DUF550 domain-containing protein [Klebsiella pneumoniae subsp. pneumoniae]HBQ5864688.1 DUF550 domain-containing protein [Klebsiella pneumoniae subsp. pneumoniae]
MTSKLTRERLEKIKSWRETYGAGSNVMLPAEEAEELARMALAAMDSEPVAFTEKHEILNMHATGLYLRAWPADRARNAVEGYTIPLYRHAQPASERDQVRIAHAEWSQATFGNVGPVGQLKHLSKEALEAAEQPGDLSEWADMQFLLWDAQRRAGVTDEQITQAMIDKLAVNKQRTWPEPKDGEPRLHIKEQPAPVVPDSYVMVPMRLTAENGAKGALSGEFSETKFVNCPECFGDDECETCDGSGRIEITVPVTWTTIKEIWAKGVEHFSATAQENN